MFNFLKLSEHLELGILTVTKKKKKRNGKKRLGDLSSRVEDIPWLDSGPALQMEILCTLFSRTWISVYRKVLCPSSSKPTVTWSLGNIPSLGAIWAFLVVQLVKNPPTMQETWFQSLCWEDPLEEGMATHSSMLAWRIPMDRGAWRTPVHGVKMSWTWLSNSACSTYLGLYNLFPYSLTMQFWQLAHFFRVSQQLRGKAYEVLVLVMPSET